MGNQMYVANFSTREGMEQFYSDVLAVTDAANVQVQEEAVAALTMLGFAQAPSQKVVMAILKEDTGAPVEQVIKLALKRL